MKWWAQDDWRWQDIRRTRPTWFERCWDRCGKTTIRSFFFFFLYFFLSFGTSHKSDVRFLNRFLVHYFDTGNSQTKTCKKQKTPGDEEKAQLAPSRPAESTGRLRWVVNSLLPMNDWSSMVGNLRKLEWRSFHFWVSAYFQGRTVKLQCSVLELKVVIMVPSFWHLMLVNWSIGEQKMWDLSWP